ncbi:ATP-dependent zinc metalloprotease YME1L1-like [Mustela lutreola]|uniref:ATP-dependent zinc metalloprotease YME1L1-like n=1 Tax=Mustela lutreola TaxID=9666 RepID=UPI002797222E|nr:ATP-dependent zinc metalloprotease YME1L1-like [Mustela lutreola]
MGIKEHTCDEQWVTCGIVESLYCTPETNIALKTVDPEIVPRGTVGFSGAELENLVNQSALKAALDGKEMVTMKELEFSKDKILMGHECRSLEIDNKNKTITGYHESSHAIIAYYTKDAMPINKATIMPRGPTPGHVSLLPENDRWNETRAQLLVQMDVSMGRRGAEELIFGTDHITTGLIRTSEMYLEDSCKRA